MIKLIVSSVILIIHFTFQHSYAQSKRAFQLYNNMGKKVSYKKLINKVKSADVVLFGEYHDNPISHWLEFELAKD